MIDFEHFARLTDMEWRFHVEAVHGIFIAEGVTTIERALSTGHVLRSVVSEARWIDHLTSIGVAPDRISVHSSNDLAAITGFPVHRGALAAFDRPKPLAPEHLLETSRRSLLLEDIVDHTNIGAIMRVAAAFGIDAVFLTPRCADPLYRRAIKVSMGNVFNVRWARLPDAIDALGLHGFRTIALTPDPDALDIGGLAAEVVDDRWTLVLGTEGDGLRGPTLDGAALRVRIPMADGVDSLNVASAAAVACFALTR